MLSSRNEVAALIKASCYSMLVWKPWTSTVSRKFFYLSVETFAYSKKVRWAIVGELSVF